MKRTLLFTGLAVAFSASSCDKPDTLLKERAVLETQIEQGQEELKALDSQFAALGTDSVTAVIVSERQSADLLQKNTALEAELAQTGQKCAETEKRLNELLPKLELYKAKLVR